MREAAEALRLTSQDLKKLGICDKIVGEPLGGAHRDYSLTFDAVKAALGDMLKDLAGKSSKALLADRRKRFLLLGTKGLAA